MIRSRIIIPVLCMILVIVASNILVQYPFKPLGLHDLLTWTNNRYGSKQGNELVDRLFKFIAK